MNTVDCHAADVGIPGSQQVHVWMLDLERHSAAKMSSDLSVLDESERNRFGKLRRERDRQQFCLTRAVVRNTLSSYCPEVQPAQWRFSRNEHGKPAIAMPELSKKIYFNVSHSGRWLVLAISGSECIGVDVEIMSMKRDMQAIARRYFTAREYADLCDLAPDARPLRFYELWTLKEAYSKACGSALVPNLGKLEICFAEDATIDAGLWTSNNEKQAAVGWNLRLFSIEEYQLALALRCDTRADKPGVSVREIDDPLCPVAATVSNLEPSRQCR